MLPHLGQYCVSLAFTNGKEINIDSRSSAGCRSNLYQKPIPTICLQSICLYSQFFSPPIHSPTTMVKCPVDENLWLCCFCSVDLNRCCRFRVASKGSSITLKNNCSSSFNHTWPNIIGLGENYWGHPKEVQSPISAFTTGLLPRLRLTFNDKQLRTVSENVRFFSLKNIWTFMSD